ncbi:MAG TPA: ATP-binding cassette domain-containing protein [Chloroflexia bacterium]|nr:ATP-binding cassette domain-containing protein [Chloroflexia bacterium]
MRDVLPGRVEQPDADLPMLDTYSDPPAIVFEHVTKRFPRASVPAVEDVSLEVAPGSLVVLFGPSGCGKTTLLKMVNRLYEHDSGRVLVEGRQVRSFKATDLRRRIGYVIQNTGLFPHMTVARNIGTVPELLGWDKERIERRVDELLRLIGLSPQEYRERYPAQLSGGQQQRVGLARAMAGDPSIMLMDEPFAAIDNITRRRLQDELLNIQAKVRKTILFVTHDIDEALRLADRMAVMRRGRIVQHGTPLEIMSRPANDFVADLLGSDDVLRRLSLLSLRSVMAPLNGSMLPGDVPSLPGTASVRDAINLLLCGEGDMVVVTGAGGEPVGVVDTRAIRRAAQGEHA